MTYRRPLFLCFIFFLLLNPRLYKGSGSWPSPFFSLALSTHLFFAHLLAHSEFWPFSLNKLPLRSTQEFFQIKSLKARRLASSIRCLVSIGPPLQPLLDLA